MAPPDRTVYLDSNILIYAMETDGEEGVLARRWLVQVDYGRLSAVISELAILEVLPKPIASDSTALIAGYKRLLIDRPNMRLVPVASAVLLEATRLRAELGHGTPDAIHVATALLAGCSGFLTNDTRLRLPPGLSRYALSDISAFNR